MPSIELTWEQFEEIRKNLEAVHQAYSLNADDGTVSNTIVDSEWDNDGVKVTIDLP